MVDNPIVVVTVFLKYHNRGLIHEDSGDSLRTLKLSAWSLVVREMRPSEPNYETDVNVTRCLSPSADQFVLKASPAGCLTAALKIPSPLLCVGLLGFLVARGFPRGGQHQPFSCVWSEGCFSLCLVAINTFFLPSI